MATTIKEIPGHLDQLWQDGCEGLLVETSQFSNEFPEEVSSLGILLGDMQCLQLLDSLHNGLSLLWGWCGLGALKGKTHHFSAWKGGGVSKGFLLTSTFQLIPGLLKIGN